MKSSLFDLEGAIQSDQATFLEERKSGLGGSDAGAVYSMGFSCRRKTWYDKRSVPVDFGKVETPEMERGIVIEPVLRLLYERRTGRKVKLMPLARHPEYDWMVVHVDGETESPQKAGPGYVEFKCVHANVMRKFKKEGLRDEYILQLQHGMAVKDYQWGSFGLLCLDPWQFHWFDVDKDQGLIDKLIQDEEMFWAQIQNGPIPEPLENLKDKRCASCPWRRTCRGEAMSGVIPDAGQGEAVRVDALAPLVSECVELGEIVKEASDLEADARDRLKAEIGERYGIVVPGYRALYPTAYPERWDTKALEGLKKEAATLQENGSGWDLDELANLLSAYRVLVASFLKAKKPPEAERSLRIYPTGD